MKITKLLVLVVLITLFPCIVVAEDDNAENAFEWIEMFQQGDFSAEIAAPYYIHQGVLYDNTTLLAYPQTKEDSSYTILEGTEYIAPLAFYSNEYLSEIIMPDNLKMIGYSAFEGCVSLTRVNMPLHLLIIDDSAFQGCESLREINLHDELYVIGSHAFAETASLKSIHIPPSVRFIGDEAMALSAIEKIQFSSGKISIGQGLLTPPEEADMIEITVPSYEYTYVEQLQEEYACEKNIAIILAEKEN